MPDTEFRSGIDERLVYNQPPTTTLKPLMPAQQPVRINNLASGIIWIDPHQHVQLVQPTFVIVLSLVVANLDHPMAGNSPVVTMLLVPRRGHTYPARLSYTGQVHDCRLAAGQGHTSSGVRRTYPLPDELLQAIVRVRQAAPDLFRDRRNRPPMRIDTGGQVQPLIQRDVPPLRGGP